MSSSTTAFLIPLITAAPSPPLLRRLSPFVPRRISYRRQFHFPAVSLSSTPSSFSSSPEHQYHHPWPEWSALLGYLSATVYFGESGHVAVRGLPEEAASACLSFARRRPDLLGMLPRRDIEVVVEKGEPFLFDDRAESVRRMRLFLMNNVLDGDDRSETLVDLMKYLLSYVSNAVGSSGRSNDHDVQLVERSVRNLLLNMSQLADQNNGGVQTDETVFNDGQEGYQHTARPLRKIELRSGDWICHRYIFLYGVVSRTLTGMRNAFIVAKHGQNRRFTDGELGVSPIAISTMAKG